jgi:hypothetical protein
LKPQRHIYILCIQHQHESKLEQRPISKKERGPPVRKAPSLRQHSWTEVLRLNTCSKLGVITHFCQLIYFHRRKIRSLRKKIATRPTQADHASLEKSSASLAETVRTWRFAQQLWMPTTSPPPEDPEVEEEEMGMPSDILRNKSDLPESITSLARIEMQLREAEAREALNGIRNTVRMLGATWDMKGAHARGYKLNTRANTALEDLSCRRDDYIETYNRARDAMMRLKETGTIECSAVYPSLSVKDTYRKPPEVRRRIGDSRFIDGALWSGASTTVPGRLPTNNEKESPSREDPALTASTRRRPRTSKVSFISLL